MDSLPLTWEGAGLGLTYPSCQAKGHTWGGASRDPLLQAAVGHRGAPSPEGQSRGHRWWDIEGEPRGLSACTYV